MSIRWLESGHTMKYGFRPWNCPRAPPSGNSSGENHISWYVPPLVNVLQQYNHKYGSISEQKDIANIYLKLIQLRMDLLTDQDDQDQEDPEHEDAIICLPRAWNTEPSTLCGNIYILICFAKKEFHDYLVYLVYLPKVGDRKVLRKAFAHQYGRYASVQWVTLLSLTFCNKTIQCTIGRALL